MFCKKCGHALDDENNFCGSCGFNVNELKTDHLSDVDTDIKTKIYSGKRTTTRFMILYFATLGLYPLFWMYDQWVFLKNKQKLDISPGWRAFFCTIWTGSLADHVQQYLKKENITVSYSPVLIGISFFILNALYKLPDPYWLITFLSFIPILPIFDAMNQYYEKYDSNSPIPSFKWWQRILVGLGLFVFLIAFISTLFP